MLLPGARPWRSGETLGQHLEREGVSRRQFLEWCGKMTVILGLGQAVTPEVARALQQLRRPSVIWLSLQECTGCTESVLRTADPTIGDLVLDLISLDFQENLMAAAGSAAEAALHQAMEENRGEYVLVVTGSVPVAEGGIYTTIAGRTARDHLEEAADGAAAIIAVGACAHFGSVQAAAPNPTEARGVHQIITDRPVVNVAGCPPIADTVTATLIHFLTFNRLPALDRQGRPLFAYGARIHDQCPRRAHFDAGQFVQEFDDEGARQGWCLYEVGCKGPATFSPCPIFQWNTRTSWPIGAGHPCIGCTEPYFWDTMTPFYERLPDVAGFGVERTADMIGAAAAVGATAGVLAHAAATGVQRMRQKRKGELPVVNGPVPPSGSSPGGPSGESASRHEEESDG
ncbi:MAG: hydrogenase small subunit [Gemmatimonadetes bacterium]|nr:hydrogenase small subunit [Gemmatimonadota bacterium]NIU73896.1 hydrogenase small subunit [Gammaproteobacteria bacterium]NIP79062.1 hydrogenase small subunit [Gemmatimonadota bacterium]NIQ53726.1 hydrogenase small subunit [Gemmatimonadota bacterium]NIX43979.1 hydrogenase small subunit [Gemmatimonadota bacterium]